MEGPKIQLSPAETELVQNAEIILTKNRVLEKMKALLEEVQQRQTDLIASGGFSRQEPLLVSPKISRGENYLGLPWLILDYPRQANGNDLFFIRSMFWWGHFFSSTLHLSGRFLEERRDHAASSYKKLGEYSIGIGADPWAHHFGMENYQRIGSFTENEFRALCANGKHLKIAMQWPLSEWQQASSRLYESWRFLLETAGQLPRR